MALLHRNDERLPRQLTPEILPADDLEEQEHTAIVCRQCRHPITLREHKFSFDGLHHHVFMNPAGVLYEIGCFRQADGCLGYGPATLEHTWFAGHTWRFALCAQCHSHLGWHYRSAEGAGFYGLILAQLLDEG